MQYRVLIIGLLLAANADAGDKALSDNYGRDQLLAIASNVVEGSSGDRHNRRSMIDRLRLVASMPMDRQDVDVVFASDLMNTSDTNDVVRGLTIARELLDNSKNTWHADWAYIYITIAHGHLADYSNQIVAAKTAINEVDYSRLENERSELYKLITKKQSSTDVRDALRLILVNAYCRTAQIDAAERVFDEISQNGIRDLARNIIEYTRGTSRVTEP
ncbi:MAG TPA: hypothetical protein PKE12_02630 [Kiritimatiellia bacterium]|nr:hypothetical protein [Kiritimatiellia bacterium]